MIYIYLFIFIYVYITLLTRGLGCNVEQWLFKFDHTKPAAGDKEDVNCFICTEPTQRLRL